MRVTTDQRVVEVRDAVVRNDSIIGVAAKGGERVAIAVQDVRKVETWKSSASATAGQSGKVLLILLVAFVAVAVAAFALGGGP